MVEAVVFIHHN